MGGLGGGGGWRKGGGDAEVGGGVRIQFAVGHDVEREEINDGCCGENKRFRVLK